MKKLFPQSNVIGIDLSQSAIDLAENNAMRYELNVEFYQLDILKMISIYIIMMCS